MIETVGFSSLVAAADAAAKAADVRVVTYQGADAGIVTIYLLGDVSSVQAAVAAGLEAAKRVGQLRASHVIPRPGPDVGKLVNRLTEDSRRKEVPAGETEPPRQASPPEHADAFPAGERLTAVTQPAISQEQGDETSPFSAGTGKEDADAADQLDDGRPEIELMKEPVARLRKLARSIKGFPLSSAEISLARKEELVRLLSRLLNERSEGEG